MTESKILKIAVAQSLLDKDQESIQKVVFSALDKNTVELHWLVYHGCFKLVLESLEKKNPCLQIWDHFV